MKLINKLFITLLTLSVSIPTFAVTKVEDTFTYSNIDDTLVGATSAGGDNRYIIASDNTIMGKGTTVLGINSNKTDTKGLWQQIVTGPSGNALSNIIKINRNRDCLYAIDKDGNTYCISGYPQKISVADEPDVKFKDVSSAYYAYGNARMTYLISEDGYVYKGNGTAFTKVEGISGAESVHNSHNAPNYENFLNSICVIIDKEGQAYYGNQNGTVTKIEGAAEVDNVYGGHYGFYFKFASGRIGYAGSFGTTITMLNVPEGETFINMFGTDQTVIGLITDKNVYKVVGTTLTEAEISWNNNEDNSSRKIMYSHGDLAVDNYGKYYTWTFSDNIFNMTPIEGIDKWANENPVVIESELANFDIPLNEILRRYESYDFTFDLVTLKPPTAFNIYYSKPENRNLKEKWVKIGDNVSVDSLSKVHYDTGYRDANGEKITGFSYTYNWQIGKEDLTGIHLIAEPIYNL